MIKYTCISCEEEKTASFVKEGYYEVPHSNAKICNKCHNQVMEEAWNEMPWYKKLWHIITL